MHVNFGMKLPPQKGSQLPPPLPLRKKYITGETQIINPPLPPPPPYQQHQLLLKHDTKTTLSTLGWRGVVVIFDPGTRVLSPSQPGWSITVVLRGHS